MSSREIIWHWSCRDHSTKIDRRIKSLREEVSDHPLQRFLSKKLISNVGKMKANEERRESSIFSDALGLILDGDDPLSAFQRQMTEEESEVKNPDVSRFQTLQLWDVKREEILSQYNPKELLITSRPSAVPRPDSVDENDICIVMERSNMTTEEFCKRLQFLHQEVIQAWGEAQRVKAIKIVIQCSKLLSESKSYSFYPIKFLYVTDILNTFGDLVYKRLKAKCEEVWKPEMYSGKFIKIFPENYTSEIVPDVAKETCYNWFFKIASIRELIPRLYVEVALLRSYRFIKTGDYEQILSRLTKMVRGVGNPIVNVYLRCYICQVAALYCNDCNYDFFAENFFEFVPIYPSVYSTPDLIHPDVNAVKYVEAYVAPMEWVVRGVVELNESVQYSLFESFRRTTHSALLLLITLTSFKSSYIISEVPVILKWMEECDSIIPVQKFIKQLGCCFEKHLEELSGILNTNILDPIWAHIFSIVSPVDYMVCVDQWLALSITHLPVKRVDNILNDIIKHLKVVKDQEKYYPQLESVIRNLVESINDFMSLIIAENFMPFIKLFRGETVKVSVSKVIMEAFIKRNHETFISDAVVLNNLMTIAKWLHDSINALSVEDEKKQIGRILAAFVRRIDFGKDFEQQLDFYVEARGYFFNLDDVHTTLVYNVTRLAFETLKVVKGRHTNKTSAFVRACAAYCFITIPSIQSPVIKLRLYMLSGQTALANQCLGQADAFLKAAIETIPEFPKKLGESTTDHIVMAYIREMYSILLVAPDNTADEGSLFLIRKLSKTLLKFPWEENNSARIAVYIQALHVMNVAYQSEYPYHFLNVNSNDSLYAANAQFRNEINELCSETLQQILKSLFILGESYHIKMQAKLSFELFFCVLIRADVADMEMAKLSVNLWNLANKHEKVDKSIAITTLKRCIRSSPPNSKYTDVFSKLLDKLQL